MISQNLMKLTKPSPNQKHPLLLDWVEDDGFEVRPVVRPVTEATLLARPPRIILEEAPSLSPTP